MSSHLSQCKLCQASVEFRQDTVITVQQNDFAILLFEIGVIAPPLAQEIVELSCYFHAT